MQHVKAKLEKCVPEDCRSHTLRVRDDEKIAKRIVENEELFHLLPRRNALLKSVEVFDAVSDKLGAEVAPKPAGIDDLLTEGKLMVDIRAACSVTFEKLPACNNKNESGHSQANETPDLGFRD